MFIRGQVMEEEGRKRGEREGGGGDSNGEWFSGWSYGEESAKKKR